MHSTWQALLWKEGREHRWKMLAMGVATAMLLPPPWRLPRDLQPGNLMQPLILIIGPVVGMFLGAGIAAREQSQSTIGFLQALPVTMRRPAMAKFVTATTASLIPGLVLLLYVALWQRKPGSTYFSDPGMLAALAYALASWSLLIWMAACGVNRCDEVRAGAIGLLSILAYWAIIAVLADRWLTQAVEDLLFAMAPAGPATLLGRLNRLNEAGQLGIRPSAFWPPALAALVSHGLLVAWYVGRFGRVLPGRGHVIESPPKPVVAAWLAPPRQNPFSAILWKQMHESAPLAALGAASILLITVALTAGTRYIGEQWEGRLAVSYASQTWMLTGFFVSIVAGVGLFIEDLRAGVDSFWRSRPINPHQWFAVKFFPALAVMLLTLALPVLIVAGLAAAVSGSDIFRGFGEEEPVLAILALGVLIQAGVFSVAAASMALLRRPVAAALLTIFASIAIAALADPFTAAISSTGLDRYLEAVALLLAAGGAVAILIAWLAIRYDWGWKP